MVGGSAASASGAAMARPGGRSRRRAARGLALPQTGGCHGAARHLAGESQRQAMLVGDTLRQRLGFGGREGRQGHARRLRPSEHGARERSGTGTRQRREGDGGVRRGSRPGVQGFGRYARTSRSGVSANASTSAPTISWEPRSIQWKSSITRANGCQAGLGEQHVARGLDGAGAHEIGGQAGEHRIVDRIAQEEIEKGGHGGVETERGEMRRDAALGQRGRSALDTAGRPERLLERQIGDRVSVGVAGADAVGATRHRPGCGRTRAASGSCRARLRQLP